MKNDKKMYYFCGGIHISFIDKRKNMKSNELIKEARRYVDNARNTLRNNESYDPDTRSYNDRKYVRAAGHYLWHAVMLALDSVFPVRADRRTRVDIDAYREAVRKRDRKLLDLLNNSYQILHLHMGYDGVLAKATCDEGFRITNDIIDKCAMMLPSEATEG